jgi:cytoskeletal protein CcmA (bactofilin family)
MLPEPPKARPAVASRAVPSIISADVKVKGDVNSQGEVQIDGNIEGNVRASALTIGESGAVKGEVIAESVIIRGTIEGRIRGRKVQLCSGAKVHGDIFHASLAIEPNAVFEGAVKHAQDPISDVPASPAAQQPIF